MSEPVRIVGYDPAYAPDFAALNYQWIEEYFKVEAEDRKALDDPEGYAIARGGEIFFVLEALSVPGTSTGGRAGNDSAAPQAPGPLARLCSMAGEMVVGTVAMVPHVDEAEKVVFELAKMAVRPDRRGLGYGTMLMRACIDFAKERNADEIMLVTNDVLAPALATYTAAGFVPVERYTDMRYERGNLEMRLRLGFAHREHGSG